MNKILEVKNSDMISTYCQVDERFRKVAMVLKHWNKNLDKHKEKRLNSFSICLMLLAYMLYEKYIVNL